MKKMSEYMASVREPVNESFRNYIDKKIPEEKARQVVDILNRSYAKIGGWGGSTVEDLLKDDTWMIKTWERGGKIMSAAVFKSLDNGKTRKSVCAGSDGSEEGKAQLRRIYRENISQTDRGFYAEVCDAPEHIYLKYCGACPVPNNVVGEIIKKEIKSLDPDGYHYTRVIHGTEHRKMLIMTGDPAARKKLIDYLSKM